MKKLAIVGSSLSGGAAQVIDAAASESKYKPVAIFDNNPNALGRSVLDVPVIASSLEIEKYWNDGLFEEIVIAIGGDLKERQRLFDYLRQLEIPFANIIDKTAQLRLGSKIGSGNVILANVFIGPLVSIGDNCYIITNTCINHETQIGSHVFFSTGCSIAGDILIGNRVSFGTGSGAVARSVIPDDFAIAPGEIFR